MLTKSIVLAIAVAIGLLFSPGVADHAAAMPAQQGGDDTPACATHGEYDRISLFQTPEVVANIVGNDGWFIDTPPPDQFARGYRSCFAPGVRFVKVWFEQDNRSSYDKAIVDVN